MCCQRRGRGGDGVDWLPVRATSGVASPSVSPQPAVAPFVRARDHTLSEINNILYTKLLAVEVAGFRFNDPKGKSGFGTTFVRREL